MDGQEARKEYGSNVYRHPVLGSEVPDKPKLSWIKRRLLDIGWLTMGRTEPQNPNVGINWTMISSVVVVLSAIVGLWYFTWQTAEQRGLDKGIQQEKERQSEARIKALENEIIIQQKTGERPKKEQK